MQVQKTIKFKVGKLRKGKQKLIDLVLNNSINAIKGYRHKKDCGCEFCLGKTDFKRGEGNFLGKKHTQESRDLMRNKKLGIKRPDVSQRFKGRTSPRKGVNLSDLTINKIKTARATQEPPNKRRKFNKKWRSNLSNSHKGIVSGMKGKNQSDNAKIKIRKARANQIFPIKDTKIEVKIRTFLDSLQIEYFQHKHINEINHSYQCDFFIPSKNLVIECDGDYWHKYPVGRDIDKVRTSELIEKGFKVLRLWECEIKGMELKTFKKIINNAVGFSFCEPKAVIELKAKKSVKLEGVSPPMTKVKGIRNTDILC